MKFSSNTFWSLKVERLTSNRLGHVKDPIEIRVVWTDMEVDLRMKRIR